MTIATSFVSYMESLGVGTFGQDIFIGETPNSNKVQDSIWWIIESGGSKLTKAFTGESIRQYTLFVYYRDRNYATISEKLFDFSERVSCSSCVELQGFETLEIEVTQFPTDQDLDSEDRKVGLLQINIKIYKSC